MLIVFDLDFTLWDAGGTWCDHTEPPYERSNGHIKDAEGRIIILYPEVRAILGRLKEKEISMALASRTHSPAIAGKLLNLFGIGGYFTYTQIFPGSKVRHFNYLQKESGIPYENIYFFDDEHRNIMEVERLGVQSKLVSSGLSWRDIHEFPDLYHIS
jgi:magnesium-dependent phosphatase 1